MTYTWGFSTLYFNHINYLSTDLFRISTTDFRLALSTNRSTLSLRRVVSLLATEIFPILLGGRGAKSLAGEGGHGHGQDCYSSFRIQGTTNAFFEMQTSGLLNLWFFFFKKTLTKTAAGVSYFCTFLPRYSFWFAYFMLFREGWKEKEKMIRVCS